MKLGYVGLGKMGFNMVERLLEKKHEVVVYDRDQATVADIARQGARAAASLKQMAAALAGPRVVWIMVPYRAVDPVLKELLPLLAPGDIVIDGGNSPYKESIRRAVELEKRGIGFLDAGVSGGPEGARSGACVMIGGKLDVFRKLEPLFRDLSAEGGYAYVGRSGSGHFVKMVHNGIEYGMMQALAEGFSVLRASPFDLHLSGIAGLFNHRSVIESRLVGWLQQAFGQYGPELHDVSGSAAQSGEGMWTVEAAGELGVPVPIISGSFEFRIQSERNPSYTGRIISALRHQFGGHLVEEIEENSRAGGSGEKWAAS